MKELLPCILIFLCPLAMAFQLFYQGRIWWCGQGDSAIWSGDVISSHNSQHLFDPYMFTHILHGVLFYWIMALVFPKMTAVRRLLIVVAAESAWEVLENTNAVIERYRAVTISLDYYGDSVANSLGDLFACAVGFIIAQKLKLWLSLVFFIAIELILIFWIHDSLLLNIVMLVYPVESVKEWQMNL
jgi:Protein of unknown function (DUF2585).